MAYHYWIPGNSSGPHTQKPGKFLIHTTEGGSIDGAIGAYRQNNSWPHYTVDYRYGQNPYRICQHLNLDVAARALKNKSGGVETNTAGVIQVEVVGYATRPGEIDWATLGTDLVAPVCAQLGIPLTSTVTWVAYPDSYGESAPQRLSGGDWLAYRGVLGHQHAAENSHGDPGLIPIDAILQGDDDLPYTRDELIEINKTAMAQAMADHAHQYRQEMNDLMRWVVDQIPDAVAKVDVPNFVVGDESTAPLSDMVGWGHHAAYHAAHYAGAPGFDLAAPPANDEKR